MNRKPLLIVGVSLGVALSLLALASHYHFGVKLAVCLSVLVICVAVNWAFSLVNRAKQ